MSEIDDLLARVAVLEKEKADRALNEPDPVSSAIAAVQDHLKVRATMLPNADLSNLRQRAADLGSPLDSKNTEAFLFAVNRFIAGNGPIAHEFAYVQHLVEELHQVALDEKAE